MFLLDKMYCQCLRMFSSTQSFLFSLFLLLYITISSCFVFFLMNKNGVRLSEQIVILKRPLNLPEGKNF